MDFLFNSFIKHHGTVPKIDNLGPMKKQVVMKRRLSSLYAMTLEDELKIAVERDLVISELISTEHNYVRHLGMVVNGYMALMNDPNRKIPAPENWNATSKIALFGNLESIYFWHRDTFLKQLERCQTDPNELGSIFERNERKMLLLYMKYSHNKVQSERMADELAEYLGKLTEELGHTQQLNELLFKPIQRITIYHMLIERIYGCTKKMKRSLDVEAVHQALTVVKHLPHNINVMMKFRDLMGYTVTDEGNGKLLYHGQLLCTDGGINANAKKRAVYCKGEAFMVYLFEKNIFFSVVVGIDAKNNDPKCYYRNHIPVNNMMFSEVFSCKYTFTIRTMHLEFATRDDPQTNKGERPKGDFVAYTCRAATPEKYTEWIAALRNVLIQQSEFAGSLENPKLWASRNRRT